VGMARPPCVGALQCERFDGCLCRRVFIMQAVDHKLQKQPYLPEAQLHENLLRHTHTHTHTHAHTQTNTVNMHHKMNAARFLFSSLAVVLSDGLTPFHSAAENQGGEEVRKKGIVYGGCARECQGDRKWMFLVPERNPLRSSRESCSSRPCQSLT